MGPCPKVLDRGSADVDARNMLDLIGTLTVWAPGKPSGGPGALRLRIGDDIPGTSPPPSGKPGWKKLDAF